MTSLEETLSRTASGKDTTIGLVCLITLENYKTLSYRRETARQLRMSTYRLASWLTDRVIHRTPRNVLCITFKVSNALIQEVLAKTDFDMK